MTVTVPRASEVDAYVDAFRDFVVSAPTAFHAAEQLAAAFGERGFVRLAESEPWECVPGGKYVVVRDGSVIAWVMPTAPTAVTPWRILGAHTDSPSLRVKDLFGQRDAEGWAQIPVEVYGGPILSSWFDRDLEFAGRLVTGDGRILLSRSGPVARVPHLAVHLDRSVNDSFSPDREAHLQPIVGTAGSEVGLRDVLADAAGILPEEVVAGDIFAVDTQPPQRLGVGDDLLASPRLDNLVSTFAAASALVNAGPADVIQAAVAFDHEEVGSHSRSGAGGSLLEDVWDRVSESLGARREELLRSRDASVLVSMDVGHLVHPNYSARHDPSIHPVPGGGPLIKVNANQRYTTDGWGEALWMRAAARAGVPVQRFVSNNDVPCGSTIGPIISTRLGVRTVDVGAGVLSMHSARELVHCADLAGLAAVAGSFLESA